MSGTMGSLKKRNVFALAERYELNEPLERVVELLRFVYCGNVAYFSMTPENRADQLDLQKAMMDMMFLSEKYSVDLLFSAVLEWVHTKCFELCGDEAYGDVFYQMEHYYRERCTEPLNKVQLKQTMLRLMSERHQMQIVTRDTRWMSLSCGLVEDILSRDDLAIGAEGEVLGLIERWNGNADKFKVDIMRLLACYRVSESTFDAYVQASLNLGFSKPSRSILQENSQRAPRDNLSSMQMTDMMMQLEEERETRRLEAMKRKKEEQDSVFLLLSAGKRLRQGFSFTLKDQQTILQNVAVRASGTYRVRLAFTQSEQSMWDPSHELFTGIVFGANRYQGYICGQSAYDCIFRVQSFTSAAPKPGHPMHLTGSAAKMEFDLELAVNMQRVNRIINCSLSVVSNNTTVCTTEFQLQNETLINGTGLRFQVIGKIPPPGIIDVSLAWVSGVQQSRSG
eukprot:GEMP01035305.1.p1 GENE.GEMP01035305.1~~GEMP01035305.1.p1  ORF type:complete len:452 (+),score=68.99 GEMP01035305.1:338-1693(+)